MTNAKPLTRPTRRTGDAAVDGLISGVIAGIVMAGYLVVSALLSGEDVGVLLVRFDLSGGASPLRGILMHLAVAGVFGIGYALIWSKVNQRLRIPGWLAGSIYAAALFLLAEAILLPIANSPLLAISTQFAVGHAWFGLTLGILVDRFVDAD